MAKFPAPVVVSFGEEEFFLDRDLQAFLAASGRAVTRFEGPDTTEAEIVSACETRDFEGRERIVIVDHADRVKFDKIMRAYVSGLRSEDRFVVLALVLRTAKFPAFWSKIDSNVVFRREHRKLKPFGANNEIVSFAQAEAKRSGLSLGGREASLLVRATGGDLYRLASEIGKFRAWLGEGSTVTLEHLQAVVSVTSGASVWDVVDAASLRDPKAAANALTSLYRFSSEDPSVPLAYALMKQAERLLIARSALDRGASEDEVASRLGMHPYRCKTFFLPMARKHTVASLGGVLRRLCRLDVEVKRSPARFKRALVEFAVLHFAR